MQPLSSSAGLAAKRAGLKTPVTEEQPAQPARVLKSITLPKRAPILGTSASPADPKSDVEPAAVRAATAVASVADEREPADDERET